MKIYILIVSSIFALWFIGTIVVQFKETKLSAKLNGYDFLHLLPLWTFFAPNPGVNDYHLLYRDEDVSGNRSDWSEVEINENRKLISSIWNPSKRSKKVLNDVIQNIIPMTTEYKETPKVIVMSLPYILILNAIMKEPSLHSDACKKQFLLSASDGYENGGEPALVLLSEFHPV